MLGVVKAVRVDRGFGFIESQEAEGDIFFHIKDVDQSVLPWDEQLTGRRVRFNLVTNDGRNRGVAVSPV